MIPAILVIWIALSIAFAAGYVLRVLLERADRDSDIDIKAIEKAVMDLEIRRIAREIVEDESPDPESRHPLNVPILVLALIPCVLLSACLPRIETVTVQECELAPLEPKPSLPAVEYTEQGNLLCLDTENQMKALEREVLIKGRVNYCEISYEKARTRCGKEN